MLYRLLFIQGILNSLYSELSSLTIIFRIFLQIYAFLFIEKGQVNYLNNVYYILAEFDWLSFVSIILLTIVT